MARLKLTYADLNPTEVSELKELLGNAFLDLGIDLYTKGM